MSLEILMEAWPNEVQKGYHSIFGISDILISHHMLSLKNMKTYDNS